MGIFLKNGDSFLGCRILSYCGRGSFGITYLAEDPVGKRIAIKILASTHSPERELKGLQNYMTVSGSHPNLLQILHIGRYEDYYYYTMEAADDCGSEGQYVPATLGNFLRNGKAYAPEEAVKIIRALLEGICVMHKAELIHRDIKPDNIIFVDGVVKLSDPGLVVAETEYATFAGTPGFLPPEMIENELAASKQSDLYAIGKVFYCMVTGNPPKKYPQFPESMDITVCRQLFPVLSCACNIKKEKRFQSTEEFLANLPQTIRPPDFFERLRMDFLDWKKLNQEKFRLILVGIITLLLCCTGILLGTYLYRQGQKKQEEKLKKTIEKFLAVNKDRKELIAFQLEVYLPQMLEKYKEKRSLLKNFLAGKEYMAAARTVKELEKFLQESALKILPPLPEGKAQSKGIQHIRRAFMASGASHGFLTTPLAEYLPEKTLRMYKKNLALFDSELYAGYAGPRSGRNYGDFSSYYCPMIFVPPGAVKLRHTGKIHKLPYHFWVWEKEVPAQHFSFMMGFSPHYFSNPNMPAERVAWNDVLYYCYKITENMRKKGTLPPGYIVRVPTEAEWEYVSKNAWLGKDQTKFEQRSVVKENSRNQPLPSGSKLPNKLGVYDIFGNVWEMVLPVEKNKLQNSVTIRGGSYLSREKVCYIRLEYLKYQCLPYDIGFRLVLAPGDMDYFDREFFISGGMQAESGEKIYELVGANLSSFRRSDAEKLAKLLGGRLAEFENKKQLDEICRKLPLFNTSWPTAVGGRKIDGKWMWEHRKKEVDFGKWQKRFSGNPEGEFLFYYSKRFMGRNETFKFPLFLCEWDKKDYPFRNEQLKSGRKLPGELTRFTVGGKTFMLIGSTMLWNSVVRFCEVLGGRLACLDTPELQKSVMKKLEAFSDRKILLGGYAKRADWYWLSGEKINMPLEEDKSVGIPSGNRNYLTLWKGKFFNSQYGHSFLCEWDLEKIAISSD